jgi:aryl-alcohol dehydrogenase-like predicted oxidoreductase
MMFGGPTTEGESLRIISRARDVGINFIDTANVYTEGESERIVGKAVTSGREQVIIATKVRGAIGTGPNDQGTSRHSILNAIDASLKRLGTSYIDVYYLHGPDYTTPIEESLRALDDCVRLGKVRYIACSNFYAWQLMEALGISERERLEKFVATQPLYNIVNRDVEVELLPLCKKHKVGVVPYSPLARGVLTGKYKPDDAPPEGSRLARGDRRFQQAEWRPESLNAAQHLLPVAATVGRSLSQFALAWVLANPTVTSGIIGPRTIEQLNEYLGALDISITKEIESAVDAIVPPGEHTGMGFNDPLYPVRGR